MAIRIRSFLPRSRSTLVFVLVMASYSTSLAYLISAWRRAAHIPAPQPSFYASATQQPLEHILDLLLFAPVIETFILIGVFELVRRARGASALQVFAAAAFISELHVWPWWPRGLIVFPGFLIEAASYLYWRRSSWKQGYIVVASIHALSNLIPAVSTLTYALPKT